MKVFFINGVCGTGSTGTIIADLLHTLKTQGHEGKVAFGIGEAKKVEPEEAIKINNKLGYYWHNALSRLTDHTGLYSAPQTRRLIKEIREYNPDVIHLHNLHGYYINYKILFAFLKEFGKPVVWTLHDCWAYTGHCAGYAAANCTQWKTGCKTCSLLRRYPACYTRGDVAYNYAQKKAAFTGVPNMTIVTPSQWLADEVQNSFLKVYPVKVIHNGINLDVFHPQESDFRQTHGLNDKKIVLGVANVWSASKGLDDMLALATRLDSSYQVVLVGLTSEQKTCLPENVLGITRTENAVQLAGIYSAADVFVNPTYEDNFPTVDLEAQACGTPVIAYQTGGTPETVSAETGIVVPQGDLDAILRALKTPLPSSAACSFSAKLRFDKTKQAQKHLALYNKIMSASS